MNPTEDGSKFTKRYSFLSIYKPKQTLNDSTFHYFTQPQPGYQRVSLYNNQSRKPYAMHYEMVDNEEMQHLKKIKQEKIDNSPIIDLQYFSSRNNATVQQTVVDRSKITRDSEWVKKYEPHKFIDLLTDEKINRNLLTWVKAWDPIVFNKPLVKKSNMTSSLFNRTLGSAPNKLHNTGQSNYAQAIFENPKKLILLAGPPGCGKTTLMRVLANHCKYEIVQINASDDRSAQNLIGKLQDISSNDTIRGNKKPALICLDQIDGVAESQSSGITKILQFIENGTKGKQKKSSNTNLVPKQGKKQYPNKAQKDAGPAKFQHKNNAVTSHNTQLNRPVIFICNDPFAKSLKQLRSRAHVVYFSQLAADRVIKRMRQILDKEKVHVEQQVLQKICEICRNDVRSCIGVLQLVVAEKRIHNKNPKDIVNRMRLSFAKDNQSSINEFLLELFAHKLESGEHAGPIGKCIEHKVMQIGNASLLMETFLNNFMSLQKLARKNKQISHIYDDLVKADILIGNGFKHNNQLDRFQMLPYFRFMLKFGSEEVKRIQFPSLFFEKLRKLKCNTQILKSIYEKIPMQIKIFMRKQSMIGSYLLSLYYSMQTMSIKQSQIVKCVSIMLTYGFNFRKQKQFNQNNPIFHPEIDVLLTYGSRKPLVLMSGATKVSMEQNYDYFKDKKQMLVDNELRDNTIAMVNQMNLHSRKKGRNEEQTIKYKFAEGTGTKTSYCLSVGYFF